jgi:hypothetical protein
MLFYHCANFKIRLLADFRQLLGLGNLDAFFGRFSRLFLDYLQVKFRLFLDGLVKI